MVSLLPMLATSLTLATVLLASPRVDVRSSTNCPSAQAIAERLHPLLPEGPSPDAAADTATIETVDARGADTKLRIRLVRAGGVEVGDRRVVVRGDCAQAATTVAAVIAAWEIEPLPSAPAMAGQPGAAAAPDAAAPPSPWQAWLGAGGGVGFVGGMAGIGRMEAVAGRSFSRFAGRVGFVGATTRSLSLATGSVDWRHTSFELGMVLRTRHPAWPLSLDAGLLLGWATLTGNGFAPSRQQRSFEYGVSTAVRLGRSLGRWSAWAEIRMHAWGQGQRASVTGEGATSATLPRADLTASLGISALLFR